MSNSKKETEQKTSGGVASWMITFSDLSTLLLTFFVLLLSMSSMDDRTLRSMFTNFTSASGILFFKEYGEIYRPKDILIDGLYDTLKDVLVVKRAEDDVVDIVSETDEKFFDKIGGLLIEEFKRGFKLVFGHQLLFDPGSAELKESVKPVLDKVAKFMKVSDYQIYIDGHTDNVPLKGAQFANNMDLSLARAYNLMMYLVQKEKVSANTFALGGYGEYRPVAPNDNAEGRARNRRVEIIFKNQKYF